MKIYEKPSVDIKRFDVEDIMLDNSGVYSANNASLDEITGGDVISGVAFEW
jgi:hypothetical protein